MNHEQRIDTIFRDIIDLVDSDAAGELVVALLSRDHDEAERAIERYLQHQSERQGEEWRRCPKCLDGCRDCGGTNQVRATCNY